MNKKIYRIFGLIIESDIELPAPQIAEPPFGFSPDVVIVLGSAPTQLANPRMKRLRYQASPGEYLLRIDSAANYYVRDGRLITIEPNPSASEEEILVFLMGSVIGALLHQRNILALHAGAVVINDQSVLFVGKSGAGKSTLAAGFYQRGYAFLADDICAIATIDGKPAVFPGFPRLTLLADVLTRLDKDKDQLKSFRWTSKQGKYLLPVEPLYNTSVPLKAIFMLEMAETDTIEITPLKGPEKIGPVIKNTYRPRFLHGLGGKQEHFRQCATVAMQTSVHLVVKPRMGCSLDELMDRLEATL